MIKKQQIAKPEIEQKSKLPAIIRPPKTLRFESFADNKGQEDLS